MKGILILTADERAYKNGLVIETGGIVHPPTRTDITYICHMTKITEKRNQAVVGCYRLSHGCCG